MHITLKAKQSILSAIHHGFSLISYEYSKIVSICDYVKYVYCYIYSDPKMLKPEKARKTSSAACHLPPWAEYNLPGNCKRKARHYSSSGTSAYSSCSSDEVDMFTDSADDMLLNIDLGESKLSYSKYVP